MNRVNAVDLAPDARPVQALARPKILLYSHDTFGLGNIRRSLVLGEVLGEAYPQSSILLVTGSPMIHAFPIPGRMDYVKLPCVDRISADRYEPRFLTECAAEVRRTRSEIIERTAAGFEPDLFIVDKRAGGIDGELVPTLCTLRSRPRPPKIVLGIRDILDAPETTRRSLVQNGSFDLIERYYDEVWIYGSPVVFDAIEEYAFPPAVAARTRYCGYLRRRPAPRKPHAGRPRVLVTTGGGGDGHTLIDAYLHGLSLSPPDTFESVVVLGPQLAHDSASALRVLAGGRSDVRFVDFDADLTRLYEAADVVVAMAGYNTVCELLSAGVRAVLVPRAHPVQEQLIRARRLSARGNFSMVEPDALTPATLIDGVTQALDAPLPTASAIDMEGLSRVRNRVQRLLEGMSS